MPFLLPGGLTLLGPIIPRGLFCEGAVDLQESVCRAEYMKLQQHPGPALRCTCETSSIVGAVSLNPPAQRSPCPEEGKEDVCLRVCHQYNLTHCVLWGGGRCGRDHL